MPPNKNKDYYCEFCGSAYHDSDECPWDEKNGEHSVY